MDVEEYRQRYPNQEEAAPGWEAITQALSTVYPGQEPRHWGTIISYELGGADPLHGISAYDCGDGGREHLHFCTYGYTKLWYDEEAVGRDYNGYGFEMTFRLADPPADRSQPIWVCNLLQNLARYVFDSGNWFAEGHWVPANGPIHADSDTAIVGLAFVNDPTLPAIDTPHGRVEFIQAFGITQGEIDALKAKTRKVLEIVNEHRQTNPLLITDLNRTDG